jgi:hypothetical protein
MDFVSTRELAIEKVLNDPGDGILLLVNAGTEDCNYHSRIRPGICIDDRRKTRQLFCNKCLSYRSGLLTIDDYTTPIKICTTNTGCFFHRFGRKIIMDDHTYRVISSWACSFATSGILEVFDSWRCGVIRSIAEESCEPYSNIYEEEYKEQVNDLLEDLQNTLQFKSRPLTQEDFFVRPLAFSYLDNNDKHRQGAVKICLRVPVESCFTLNGNIFCSASSANMKL